MRAAVVTEAGRLQLADAPEPVPDPHQALVRTLAAGLCGTDRHIVQGTFYRQDYPSILGHESVGRVVAVGDRVRSFRVGDLVLRTSAVRPGERLGGFGSMLGAFAEWALATDVAALAEDSPETVIRPLDRLQAIVPATFDPLDAGAFIALKETLSWLRRLADPRDRRVVIIGTGPAAMAFVQLARLQGAARIVVIGRRAGRLAMARRLGADLAVSATPDELARTVREATDGLGADIVIEAAGSTDLLEAVPDGLARGGIVGVYGVSVGQAATLRWGWDRPVPRTWSLRFEEPDEAGIHEEALALVGSGRYALKSTLTHVLPFGQVVEAMDVMDQEDACKVAIDFRDSAVPR